MGYAGGEIAQPTYRRMGDHTECFEVDFDPTVVSYEDLLELFWQSHDPTKAAWKTQYASLVLTRSDEQLVTARESAQRVERLYGERVHTRIEPLKRFWMAEDYHQKYYLRQDRTLLKEFRGFYPHDADFVASTAAARVNGYLGGFASASRLVRELESLGLSETASARLQQVASAR